MWDHWGAYSLLFLLLLHLLLRGQHFPWYIYYLLFGCCCCFGFSALFAILFDWWRQTCWWSIGRRKAATASVIFTLYAFGSWEIPFHFPSNEINVSDSIGRWKRNEWMNEEDKEREKNSSFLGLRLSLAHHLLSREICNGNDSMIWPVTGSLI